MKKPWYITYSERHTPDEVITANNEGSPYLHRWYLIPKNKFCNIYLHQFLGPDQRVMHDHPWISLAYLLQGAFIERYQRTPDHTPHVRELCAGRLTYRSSIFQHYLRIPAAELGRTWTIFITGPKIRDWGFVTKSGWLPWRKYIFNNDLDERRAY